MTSLITMLPFVRFNGGVFVVPGVRLANGKSVPFEGTYEASVIQPDGAGTSAFIIYDNYRVILKWNKSNYFATSVGLLSDKIKG